MKAAMSTLAFPGGRDTCCATPPDDPPKRPGGASAIRWTGSRRRNAQITSGTRDMLPFRVAKLQAPEAVIPDG